MSLKEYRIKWYDFEMRPTNNSDPMFMNRGVKLGESETYFFKREVFEWEAGKPGFTHIKLD